MARNTTTALIESLLDEFSRNRTNGHTVDLCYRKMACSKESMLGRYDSFTIRLNLASSTCENRGTEHSLIVDVSLNGIHTPSCLVIDIAERTQDGHLTNESIISYVSDQTEKPKIQDITRSTTRFKECSFEDDKSSKELDIFLLELRSEMPDAIFTSKERFEINQVLKQARKQLTI